MGVFYYNTKNNDKKAKMLECRCIAQLSLTWCLVGSCRPGGGGGVEAGQKAQSTATRRELIWRHPVLDGRARKPDS